MSAVITARAPELLDALLHWLNARFAPEGPVIVADTPLFRSGLLDSIRILDLIAFTERAIGGEIPDARICMDNFASAARIAETFGAGGTHATR